MKLTPSEWFLWVVKHPKTINAPVNKRIQIFLRAQISFGKLWDNLRRKERIRLENKLADSPDGFLKDSS